MGNSILICHKSGPKKKHISHKQPEKKYLQPSNVKKIEIPYFPWNNRLYSGKVRIAVYYRPLVSREATTPKPIQQRLCTVRYYKHAKEFMLYSPADSLRIKDFVQYLWGPGEDYKFKVPKWEANKWVPTLKTLRLDFGICENICDRDLADFSFRIFRNTPCLKNLVLKFKLCRNLTNKGINILGSEIAKNLIHLETLEFTLYDPIQINDTGIKEFIALLCRYLTKLQHFKFAILYLRRSSKIGDESLEALGKQIGNKLINLTSLNIKFYYSQSMTGEGLQALVSGLSQLSNLKRLKLIVSMCRYLTDFGLKDLGTQLSTHFISLKYLTLHLDNTAMTFQGLVGFAERIKMGNIALEQFIFIYPGFNKIPGKEKNKLSQILKTIPKFELRTQSFYG